MRAPDANVAPEFASATATKMVAENTAAGEDIGNPVAASDANSDALTYALSGTDAASFDIDADTGQLMTKEALDYETKATYSVTVTASDSGGLSDSIDVTITVTNVEEPGMVTLWASATDALTMAPQVGDTITGAVMDPDGGVTGESWQWSRTTTPDMMDSWMDIAGETNAAYMVTAGDTGYYLRVMATYTDAAGTAMEYSMPTMMVTMMTVPMFESETATRVVAENMAAGMNIGDPVTATDDDNDILTYTLEDADGGTDGDSTSFDIDADTGQLMTKEALDYETKATYSVTVTASDSGGLSDSIDVTITVTDVDENVAPGFADSEDGARSVDENTAAGENIGEPVMATDADDDMLTYTLSGTDASLFDIDESTGQLMTMANLDYETPADANIDNTYMVTVEANDGTNTAMKAVTINVTNVDEDGTVSLSTQRPRVGTAITATLTDADGSVTGTAWQWASSDAMDGTYTNIEGATSESYTPVEGDANMYLRATVMYTDGHGSGKSEMAVSANAVVPTTGNPVADGYDANNDGTIDRAEVGQAVRDFIGRQIEHDDVLQIIAQYFKDLRSGS